METQVSVNEYNVLNEAAAEYLNSGIITLKCPRCGSDLVYELFGSVEIIHCSDSSCIKSVRRGI